MEREYAAKLRKLANTSLGSNETGHLKTALTAFKQETLAAADARDKLSATIAGSLEARLKDFEASRETRRRPVGS